MQSLITTTLTAGLFVVANPVAATTVMMQFSGHVTRGIDTAGLFGAPGSDLAGAAFTATSRFDMPYPQRTEYTAYDYFDAHLLINGQDYAIAFVPPSPPWYQHRSQSGFYAFGTGGSKYGYSILSAGLYTPAINVFAWVNADNLTEAGGWISGPTKVAGRFDAEGDSLALETTGFSMKPPPALPEPASWALMVSGFGMVGAALRRQRPRHASSIASL